MAAPFTITIGGTTWSTFTQPDIEFTNVMDTTVPTLTATIYDKNSVGAIPQMAEDVIVTDSATGLRLWGGILSMCTARTEGISRYFDIQAQGYAVLLQRTMCYASFGPNFTYINLHGDHLVGDLAIIAAAFEKNIYGESGKNSGASEIVVDPSYCKQGATTLSSLNFIFSYLQEVVSLLANYVGFTFYVDPYENLHYYFLPDNMAPFALSSPDEATIQGLTTVQYRSLKWKRDFTRPANNFVVVGTNTQTQPQTRIIASDGVALTISTQVIGQNYPIAAPAGEANILISINTGTDVTPIWTPKTVGTANVDDPTAYDCMFDPINQILIFKVAPPNLTNSILIIFTFTYATGQPYPDLASIATYGRVFSQRQIASDANSAITMQSLVSRLDQQYANPLEVLTLNIADSDFPAGNNNRFSAGQWIPFHNQVLDITSTYYIHSIKTRILGGINRNYEIELRSYTLG